MGTLRQQIPEVNANQWSYLYYLLDDQLDLSQLQQIQLQQLLELDIKK